MCTLPNKFRTQHENNRQASNLKDQKDPTIAPIFMDTYTPASEAIAKWHDYSLDLFDKLIGSGVCREQARGVLPQNLYAKYYGTVNLSNLLKFIDLRTHEGAQWEIQKMAEACLDIAQDIWPFSISTYRELRE